MTTQTVTQISAAARGKWPVILQMLRIDVPENGRHGPCPKCGGKDRFRLDDLDGRGTWICSQCGNGDGLDLVKLMTGYGVRKAAQEVAQVLNVPDVQELSVKPARQKAPKRDMSLTVAALMKESHTGESPYLTGKGFAGYPASLTGSVQHISGKDFPAGSLLLPLTTNAGAVTGAQLIAPTGEKSILPGSTMKGAFVALSPLPSEPPVQVVITEGYATALTVSQLTAGCVVAAISAGNLPNVAQSLRARWPEVKIIIAGDNDFQDGGENPGRSFAERAAKAVGGWMTLPPGEIKADWNDFHREHGITRAREAFRNGLVLCGEGRTQLPHGFRLTQEYLWYEKQVQRNGETEIQNVKICNPLRVTAITCDADGGNFGRLLEWEDTWGERRRWAMPMEMLSGSGEELRRVLLVNGLSYISTTGEARARLMEYISLCKPERRVTCVSRTGWHGQVYVLQDEVSGEGAESVILQTTSVQGRDFRVSGTTEEWREHVSRYCTGNSRVAFAVSLAFAAPLLRLVGMDGGGYHLKGESTDGKTTTMKAATSVCGGPDYWQTWRATGNALEGCASRRNDAAMMLDEIREVD
ncbi:DUF927 domain-containing protein, partial [Salmonella enterica subsp. enterica serovar Muenchen]|nr:DUF927 domain-containing protein [Salmonella enterica subsp. enterica serovar Muenchen]